VNCTEAKCFEGCETGFSSQERLLLRHGSVRYRFGLATRTGEGQTSLPALSVHQDLGSSAEQSLPKFDQRLQLDHGDLHHHPHVSPSRRVA
jgi:hypothetical protein